MNSNLLKATIIKNGETQEKLAKDMGLQTSALNMRINGKIEFRRNEIIFIKQRYNLSSDEVDSIFFDEIVSKIDTCRRMEELLHEKNTDHRHDHHGSPGTDQDRKDRTGMDLHIEWAAGELHSRPAGDPERTDF